MNQVDRDDAQALPAQAERSSKVEADGTGTGDAAERADEACPPWFVACIIDGELVRASGGTQSEVCARVMELMMRTEAQKAGAKHAG